MHDENLITDIIGRVLEKQKAIMNHISYASLNYRSPRRFKRKKSSGRAYVKKECKNLENSSDACAAF